MLSVENIFRYRKHWEHNQFFEEIDTFYGSLLANFDQLGNNFAFTNPFRRYGRFSLVLIYFENTKQYFDEAS